MKLRKASVPRVCGEAFCIEQEGNGVHMNKGVMTLYVCIGLAVSAGALSAASNSTGMVCALLVMAAYWIGLPCILGSKYEKEEKEKKEQNLRDYDKMVETNDRVFEVIKAMPIAKTMRACEECEPHIIETDVKFRCDALGFNNWNQFTGDVYRKCYSETCKYGSRTPETALNRMTLSMRYDNQILERDPNQVPTEKPICRMCNGKSCLELKRIVVDEATDEHYYFWHCTKFDSYQTSEYKRKL